MLQAWQACLEADPTDEEAASALMRLYVAQGRRPLAVAVYERCRPLWPPRVEDLAGPGGAAGQRGGRRTAPRTCLAARAAVRAAAGCRNAGW